MEFAMRVKPRIFTLREARELLPRVKALTADAAERVEAIRETAAAADDEAERARCEHDLDAVLRAWAQAIAELGAEPKGVFLVDFDSGDGFYYCWKHGEEDVEYMHSYEGGFAARRPIPRD